ncbi:MAG: hypothetical protein XD78_1292 [Desulfotomaculum sp. 46_296]|nr:MAG: hypothetical protein XD78_1292 [Desulfotomaculum sp. 46_296]
MSGANAMSNRFTKLLQVGGNKAKTKVKNQMQNCAVDRFRKRYSIIRRYYKVINENNK